MNEWKKLHRFEDYSGSIYGEIRNDTTGRIMKYQKNRNGYLLTLRRDNMQFTVSPARILAETFIGVPDKPMDIGYRDNDNYNLNIENLYWRTRRETVRNAIDRGSRYGIRNTRVKILETGEEFDSLEECASVLHCDIWFIRHSICNVGVTANGYHIVEL